MDAQITAPSCNGGEGASLTTFPLESYEVVKVESSLPTNKPTITFKYSQVYVNAELLKCAPNMVYALFLIDRDQRKLILYPCDRHECDAVRLRTIGQAASKPRHIRAAQFCSQLFEYMQWDSGCRYKALGSPVDSNDEILVVFDLMAAVRFELSPNDKTKPKVSPQYNQQLSGSFGPTMKERFANPPVTQIAEDTMLSPKGQDNDLTDTTAQHDADRSTLEVIR